MELKELVSETLKQIAEGAKDATGVMKEAGVSLNSARKGSVVEFDVSIDPTKGIGILGPSSWQEGTRIKFMVPIKLPTCE